MLRYAFDHSSRPTCVFLFFIVVCDLLQVLAAANPVHGRYDDMKSAAENIDFLPTILSRFDLIFIVRDERDEVWMVALLCQATSSRATLPLPGPRSCHCQACHECTHQC